MARWKGNKKKKKMELIKRYGSDCTYCGTSLTFDKMTIDHVVPRSVGKGIAHNLRISCQPCNQAKGNYTADQWLRHISDVISNTGFDVVTVLGKRGWERRIKI